MKRDYELVHELGEKLDELHASVTDMKERGIDSRQVELATANFEAVWHARLVQEQQAEIRGARVGIDTAIVQRGHALEAELGDRAPVLIFRDRAKAHAAQFNPSFEQAQELIKDHYNELRAGVTRAMEDIENGDEPTLKLSATEELGKPFRSDDDPPNGGGSSPAEPESVPSTSYQENAVTAWKRANSSAPSPTYGDSEADRPERDYGLSM